MTSTKSEVYVSEMDKLYGLMRQMFAAMDTVCPEPEKTEPVKENIERMIHRFTEGVISARLEKLDDIPEQEEGLAEAVAGGLKDSTDVGNIAGACRDFGCEQLDDLAAMLKGGLK